MDPTPRILKNAAPPVPARIPAAVREADLRVRERVAAAEAQAAALLAEAEARCVGMFARAEAEGHRAGLARAGAVLAAAAAARERRLAAVERELAAIALDVAARILGRELAARADAVVDLAAQALAAARDRRSVVLRVHPDDAAAVRGGDARLAAAVARAPLGIREDPGLPRGGVVVETEAGWIDARLETRLADLRRALEEELP